MRTMARAYPNGIAQQPVLAQLPWSHITGAARQGSDPQGRARYAAQDVRTAGPPPC